MGSGANCQILHFNNLIIIVLFACFRQYMTPLLIPFFYREVLEY